MDTRNDTQRNHLRPSKPKATRKRTEGDIQAKVVDYLSLLGFIVMRTNAGAIEVAPGRWFHGVPEGYADLHCCAWGMFLAVETKAPRKGLRPKQQEYRDRVEAAGGTYITCHDLGELREALSAAYGPQRVGAWESEGRARQAAKKDQRDALMRKMGQIK